MSDNGLKHETETVVYIKYIDKFISIKNDEHATHT